MSENESPYPVELQDVPTRAEALSYKESLGVVRTREEAEEIAREEG